MAKKEKKIELPSEVMESLSDLARRVRLPHNRRKLWSYLSPDEQRQVERRKKVGPDIVDIWMYVKQVSDLRAVIDMAYEAEVILSQEHDRLLKQIGEQDTSLENDKGASLKPVYLGHVLMFGGKVAREVRECENRTSLQTILGAFQVNGWPCQIVNPFHIKSNQHTYRSVHNLNKGLKYLRFRVKTSAGFIYWEVVDDSS